MNVTKIDKSQEINVFRLLFINLSYKNMLFNRLIKRREMPIYQWFTRVTCLM